MKEISEIIYNNLCQQEIEREIKLSESISYDIEASNFDKSILDVTERLKVKLKSGKYSKIIIEQLALHIHGLGENFGNKVEFYNTAEILNLIENIENDKVKGTPFNGEILKGNLHIHHNFFSGLGYSIIRNVKEYWYKNKKIRNERKEQFESIIKKYGNSELKAIAITMHQIAILNKELKGEWLIYKSHDNIKYYLCLATHNEGDINIYNNKINKCLIEFPELR